MADQSRTEPVKSGLVAAQAVGDAAKQVGERAGQAGSSAVQQAKDLASDAQTRGTALASAVGEQVSAAAETQKQSLADQLEDIAQAVHRSGAELEGHQDWAARLVERGAAELSTIASTLRHNDVPALMENVQDLARRQPALFTGASFAAGFALARVGRVAVAGASKADLPEAFRGQP
ncbi:hypothetical protein [Lichenicoccus roseus]|uniref:Uncharacterized protein n=1 Tax=Lichenicoccus roseus TaxID=2683649 RepID=A0A5R9J965_9PROT|nr:hypothetical protein [Lichenicoccus roseus]TLU70768.1 hypothetical protein FE263_20615 [Lichenicoccus roseus]